MITNKDKPQQEGIFKNFFEDLKEKGKAEGRAEGKAEGSAEGKSEGRAESLSILCGSPFLVDTLEVSKIITQPEKIVFRN